MKTLSQEEHAGLVGANWASGERPQLGEAIIVRGSKARETGWALVAHREKDGVAADANRKRGRWRGNSITEHVRRPVNQLDCKWSGCPRDLFVMEYELTVGS